LYSNSLLLRFSLDCLRSSGYRHFCLEFSKRRFYLLCSAQVKYLSRSRPRYLTLVTGGIILFAKEIEGTTPFLWVKVICEDFSLFIFILQF